MKETYQPEGILPRLVWKLTIPALVIFPTSIMVLFEIHQRFKGNFLNELRVSFNNKSCLFMVTYLASLKLKYCEIAVILNKHIALS